MTIAKSGDLDALRTLLASPDVGPATINYRGMWDNTPLMSACQYKHEACALALVAAGADVNALNERGNTALLHAALEGLPAVVAALLAAGAQPNVCASVVYNGQADANQPLTPLGAACINGHVEVVAALVDAGAPSRQSALASTVEAHLTSPATSSDATSKWLATYGDLVTATPSKLAAMGEHQAIVDLLEDRGATATTAPPVTVPPVVVPPVAAPLVTAPPVAIPPVAVPPPVDAALAPGHEVAPSGSAAAVVVPALPIHDVTLNAHHAGSTGSAPAATAVDAATKEEGGEAVFRLLESELESSSIPPPATVGSAAVPAPATVGSAAVPAPATAGLEGPHLDPVAAMMLATAEQSTSSPSTSAAEANPSTSTSTSTSGAPPLPGGGSAGGPPSPADSDPSAGSAPTGPPTPTPTAPPGPSTPREHPPSRKGSDGGTPGSLQPLVGPAPLGLGPMRPLGLPALGNGSPGLGPPLGARATLPPLTLAPLRTAPSSPAT